MFIKIENFLERFRKLKSEKEDTALLVKKEIKDLVGDVDFRIKLKNGDIHIWSEEAVVRNEIFLKQNEILKNLRGLKNFSSAKINFKKF